jgi:hypothetical protein
MCVRYSNPVKGSFLTKELLRFSKHAYELYVGKLVFAANFFFEIAFCNLKGKNAEN